MNASTRSRMLDRFGISKGSSTPGAWRRPQTLARLPLIGVLCTLVAFAALAPFDAALNSETITTFGANCATPQTIFHLGDTVCAEVQGSLLGEPPDGTPQRRLEWIAPNGFIFQLGPDIISDPQNNSIVIPATGLFARVGTWTVQTVDSSNNGYASTTFVVLDQNNAAVDLWASISGPFQVSAGSSAPFTVFVTNKGPNDAQNVQLTVSVATNSIFQSETQMTGPAFSCTNPGGTGNSTCTIASLPANATARFVFVFQIDAGAPGGSSISSSASVSSSTAELFIADNSSTAFVTLPPQGQVTCDVNCPSDITVPKTAGMCGAVVTFTPTGSGCGTIVCNPASGSTFPIGTTNVVCSGDTGGPCTFTVTVKDLPGPSITCPANVTANESSPGFGLAVVNYPPPTLNDNCTSPVVACSPPSGSSFPVGTTNVVCQTSDGSGGTVNCSFTVTVTGSSGSGCTITCPEDITRTATTGQCGASVTYPDPTPSGTCGTVTCTPASGSMFPVGVTAVTCSGGGESCGFTITVVAAAVPTITTCASNKIISANADCEAVVPNLVGEVVATGCTVTITQSPEAGTIVGAGTVTVIITAEDATGQTSSCSATVTIRDITAPSITCPTDISHSNDTGQCGAIVTYAAPSAEDTCSTVTTTCSPASGAVFPVGATVVTCTAADEAGNHASCSFTVTVTDTQAPTLTCPANISTGTDPGQVTATVTYQTTVNDNCPGATVVCTPSSGAQFPLGTTTVNCTATDAANNHGTPCSFTVSVADTQPPTISCPGNITANSASGECSAGVTYPDPTVTDNQPNPTFSCSPASGSTFPVGPTIVTCTATDAGGNQSNCSFAVTVRDIQAPAIACPANITVSNTPGQCSSIVDVGTATATDNCSVASISGVRSDGLGLLAPYPVGTTTITWTARDAAGNQVSCTQTILVNDTQAPVISGAAATPSSLWPPNHKMVDVAINYTVTDNCTSSGAINCDLTVSSNEPPGSGDGHTSPDWTVLDPHHLKLKSERNGEGNGRIYTITITCKDSRNNTTTQIVTVTVPHNQ